MAPSEEAGRLGEEFFATGSSSFTEFLAAYRPDALHSRASQPTHVRLPEAPRPSPAGPLPLPNGGQSAPDHPMIPHGTTVLALTYRDGVLIAGDRRATMGHVIAERYLEKVLPADDYTAIAIAGSVGMALDMVKLYQVELTHFEKVEGAPMTLNAKVTRLATMVRQRLGQAMQGLAVVPLLAGYDLAARDGGEHGRIFSFDIVGGMSERRDFHAEGSGSPYARGALKKLFHHGMSRREAALVALHALYDAADDDSATGGPDLSRRIYPVVSVITEDGYERLPEAEVEALSRAMVDQRQQRPNGPTADL